ncbi:hypothetical protein ACLKA6_008437 [Drosophila palustris]
MEEQQQQQQQHQQHQQQQQQQQQQQHQQHQHQHQNQCDPAVPNGQYTGSKSALQMLKQQQLQQNYGSIPSSTSYRMLEQVAASAVAADCGRDPHGRNSISVWR